MGRLIRKTYFFFGKLVNFPSKEGFWGSRVKDGDQQISSKFCEKLKVQSRGIIVE
ncbi:MAG: hypothetical protein ACI9IP_002863 [Arcticibacterium sp.]